MGCPTEAAADFQESLNLGHNAGDAEWECRGLISLANVQNYRRDPEMVEQCASRALEIASRIGRGALWSEATGQLANSRMVIGRVAEAHELFAQSVSAARSLNHTPAILQSLTYAGVGHFFRSRYAEAEAAEAEASRIAAESRNGFYLALSLMYLGFSRANLGRISHALSALDEALDMARRNGDQIVLSRAPNAAGWIHREIGSLREAIGYNETSVETARHAGATEAESNALINLIYDYTMVGEPARAFDAMQRADALFDRELWNRWRFFDISYQAAAAEYWLVERNLDRADEHGRRLLANAERQEAPKYIAVAHRLLGEIAAVCGDSNAAEQELARSLEPFAQSPAPLVERRNHAALGRVLNTGRRRAAAREAFRRAAVIVHQVAADIVDLELRSRFLEVLEVRQVLSEASP